MQIFYYPQSLNRISGSENSDSHKLTFCVDMADDRDFFAYAPAAIKVVKTYQLYQSVGANSVWFTTLEKVVTPTFNDYVTFRMAHGNDADLRALGVVEGKVFQQGEKFYKMGMKGTTAAHIHFEMGRGTLTGTGWKQMSNGNWTITTTGGGVHSFAGMFLRKGTQVFRFNQSGYPQDSYAWVMEPTIVQANMIPIADTAVKINAGAQINFRQYATISSTSAVYGLVPTDVEIKVLAKSSENFDNYMWLKIEISGVIGYMAVFENLMSIYNIGTPNLSLVITNVLQTFVEFTWSADRICDALEVKINDGNWVNPIDLKEWNMKKVDGLLADTGYLITFRAKAKDSQRWGEASINVTTAPMNEVDILKEKVHLLELKNADIISKSENDLSLLKASIEEFKPINETLYTKG